MDKEKHIRFEIRINGEIFELNKYRNIPYAKRNFSQNRRRLLFQNRFFDILLSSSLHITLNISVGRLKPVLASAWLGHYSKRISSHRTEEYQTVLY